MVLLFYSLNAHGHLLHRHSRFLFSSPLPRLLEGLSLKCQHVLASRAALIRLYLPFSVAGCHVRPGVVGWRSAAEFRAQHYLQQVGPSLRLNLWIVSIPCPSPELAHTLSAIALPRPVSIALQLSGNHLGLIRV